MNTPFDRLDTTDVAKMLGVDRSTITGWCRRNLVNYINVGDGDKNNRYMFDEDEVRYIKKLIDKHGVRKMLLRYDKNWKNPVKEEESVPELEVQRTFDIYDDEEDNEVKPAIKDDGFDPNEVLNTIIYIRDIKTRLKDLEEEKKNLLEELEKCTNEVMGVIG